MRYVKIEAETPYCGTDMTEYLAFEDEVPDAEIYDYAEDIANDHYDRYEYLATDDMAEEDYATIEDFEVAEAGALEDYRERCGWSWEEVSREEWEENGGGLA